MEIPKNNAMITTGLLQYPLFGVVALGVITGSLSFHFGSNNDYNLIPIVKNIADSSVLAQDFFVRANIDSFGARFYIAHGMGYLCRFLDIQLVFFMLHILSQVTLLLATYKTAKILFPTSILTPLLALFSVLVVLPLAISGNGDLNAPNFEPRILAVSLALLGISFVLEDRKWAAWVLFLIGALTHPLVGVISCGLVLGAKVVATIYSEKSISLGKVLFRRTSYFWPFLLFLVMVGLIWVIPLALQGNSISSDEFIFLVAKFRHPHHMFPRLYSLRDYVILIVFVIALVAYLVIWAHKHGMSQKHKSLFLIITGIMLSFFFCGNIFVDYIPTRLFVTLQPYRFVFLISWIGFICFSRLCVAIFSPPYVPIGLENYLLRSLGIKRVDYFIICARILLFGGMFISLFKTPLFEGRIFYLNLLNLKVTLAILGIIIICQFRIFSKITKYGTHLMWITIIVAILTRSFILPTFTPQLTKVAADGGQHRLLDFIRNHTPKDAIILTPPNLASIRALADRAIVIDFKCFPLTDAGMKEWYIRLKNVYGSTSKVGFNALNQMKKSYHNISMGQLSAISKKYGARYAVVYKKSKLSADILFTDGTYDFIEIIN